tara:strand:+ start:143 stop:331 length:189 start_codon:yes stop_codon:yes gene_type:complete
MEDKNLINLIKYQQERIDQLEKDRDDLLTGHRVLLTYINTQDDKIMALNERWVEIHSNRGQQ